MNIVWSCSICTRTEKTSPNVPHIPHLHGGQEIELTPYKKPRRSKNEVTVKSLKAEVWDLFSEYVRRSEADKDGICECVTCRKRSPWKAMQAGHYIHGTSFLIPELVHPQCPVCNGFKAGMNAEYKEWMIKKYGQEELDKLEYLAKRPHKFTVFELQQFKKMYQEKLKGL